MSDLTKIELATADQLDRLAAELRDGGKIASVTYEPQMQTFRSAMTQAVQRFRTNERDKITFEGYDKAGDAFEFSFFASAKELGIV